MERIALDLIPGKIVQNIGYENLYHQAVFIQFTDGTRLWIRNDFYHGCVEAVATAAPPQ